MDDAQPAGQVYCRACGAAMSATAEECPDCGTRQGSESSSGTDLDAILEGGNPFVAAALSALLPGLGQIYNRELERGLVFLVGSIAAAFSVVVLVGLVLYPAVWVYAIYDAYTRAEAAAE